MLVQQTYSRDKAYIRDTQPATNEIAVGGEDVLQHTQYAENLLLVPLDRARNLLGVEEREPARLAEVGTRMGKM